MKTKRERYIPENSKKFEIGKYTIYSYEKEGKLLLLCYRGKSAKPNWHYRYSSEQQRAEQLEKHIKSYEEMNKQEAEQEYKMRMKAQVFNATLQEGVILCYSWGYEQTNVDFFQVVGRKGKSTVILRQIEVERGEEFAFMQAMVMPKKDAFYGNAFEKRIKSDWDALSMDFGIARLWDGQPMRISWYA